MTILKILGSVYFAVFLIGSLAVTLIVSTTLESHYGTPFAQRFIYQAGWFDVFLALIGVNIVASTLTRFPFKKKHTGFIITHIGILMLLVGSLLSRLLGVEGQMALYEGEASEEILEDQFQLVLHQKEKKVSLFDLVTHPGQMKRELLALDPHTKLYLNRVLDNTIVDHDYKEGSPETPSNPAIFLNIAGQTAGFNETFWLVKNNPYDPQSSQISLGPATIRIAEKSDPKPQTESKPEKSKIVIKKNEQEVLSLPLEEKLPEGETKLEGTDLRIVGIKYFPDARVENNQIISVSEKPLNPAVEFDVYDSKGKHERHTKFAFFPEFESLHGRSSPDYFNLSVDFVGDFDKEKTELSGPVLTLYPGKDGWSYESKSSKGKTQGKIEIGQTYPTGWMDFSFRAEKLLNQTVISKNIRQAKGKEKGELGAEISLVQNGTLLKKDWVLESAPLSLQNPEGDMIFAFRRKMAPVPFHLSLKDFRKVDYPGTNRAASYESDVLLHDEKENLKIEKTIRMNKPLDYKGFRIFQSSFAQDPVSGEASVFTVAKNPGITLIYSGTCVLFLGVFLTFFVPPLSSFKT